MRRTSMAASALAVLALAAAGCGGSDGGDSGYGTGDAEPASAADYGKSDGAANRVKIRDGEFTPATASVKVGDTVTFENAGQAAHTATATDGAKFDSGNMAAGATFDWKAAKAGRINYVCEYHPAMTGTIVVD